MALCDEIKHKEKLYILEKIKSFEVDLNNLSESEISRLELELQQLKVYIAEKGEEKSFIVATTFLVRKLSEYKKKKSHLEEINKLEYARKNLEFKVLNIHVSDIKNADIFNELRNEADKIEEKIVQHGDNCYAIANLRQALKDIKGKIVSLTEDYNNCRKWFVGTSLLTGTSIVAAFIPGIGPPIAAVLGSTSYLGKLYHRVSVSRSRKEKFT